MAKTKFNSSQINNLSDIMSPENISGLTQWVDFTDLSTITVNGSNRITGIVDKSGNANNFSGSVPFIRANSSLNNKSVANFTGSLNLTSSVVQAQPFTIYFYAKFNSYVNLGLIVTFGYGDFIHSIMQYGAVDIYFGSDHPNTGQHFIKQGKWCLFRFSIDALGNRTASIDDEYIVGQYYGDQVYVGTGSTISVGLGDTYAGGSDYEMAEYMLINGVVNNENDRKIRNYFFKKYKTTFTETYYAFGDSVTFGNNATSDANSYVGRVGTALGVKPYNYGIPATRIGYPPTYNATGQDLTHLYNKTVVKQTWNAKGYVTFAYGINDAQYDTPWKDLYKSLIQRFIDTGFDKSKIGILIPSYGDGDGLIQVNTAIQEIAEDLGIVYINSWQALKDAGKSGTHPDDSGHEIIGNAIIAAFGI